MAAREQDVYTDAAGPDEGDNLALWNRLARTDPRHTKSFKRAGGFSGTAIKPMWAFRRATEAFGPIGHGWGYDELETRTEVLPDGQILCFVKVRVWYRYNGAIGYAGPQWGGDFLYRQVKERMAPDDEGMKKALTDALTKCLSYIGIAADVHMGQFDDTKYVDALAREYSEAETSERRRAEAEAKNAAVERIETAIARAGSRDALAALYRDAQREVSPSQDPELWSALKARFAERGQALDANGAAAERSASGQGAVYPSHVDKV